MVLEEVTPEILPAASFCFGIEGAGFDQARWNDGTGGFDRVLAELKSLDRKAKSHGQHLNQLRDVVIAETAVTVGATLVTRDANLAEVVRRFGGQAGDPAQLGLGKWPSRRDRTRSVCPVPIKPGRRADTDDASSPTGPGAFALRSSEEEKVPAEAIDRRRSGGQPSGPGATYAAGLGAAVHVIDDILRSSFAHGSARHRPNPGHRTVLLVQKRNITGSNVFP
jgi:hypothetical protein